jgi:enoyl-CoA hydratase/carnithine racemase
MASDSDNMVAEKDGAVGWMIFNNPDRRNAVSYEMRLRMVDILEDFRTDDDIRVVAMKGLGDKAFVSGSDISQFESRRAGADDMRVYSQAIHRVDAAFAALEKPLIAMIHGFCLGYGMMVAMHADLRIVAEDAQFGIPAARLGLGFPYSAVKQLVDLVGHAHAREILLTARRFSAAEALAMGLVHRVVARDALAAALDETAATIAANAPLTLRCVKAEIAEALKDESARDLARCEALVAACAESRDYAEGRRAFMEKRKPEFTGR